VGKIISQIIRKLSFDKLFHFLLIFLGSSRRCLTNRAENLVYKTIMFQGSENRLQDGHTPSPDEAVIQARGRRQVSFIYYISSLITLFTSCRRKYQYNDHDYGRKKL